MNTMLLSSYMFIVTLFAMAIGALLVWFALLREDQMFWTNAGGYPVWLRDLVLITYLPLLAAMALLLLILSVILCAKICGSIQFFVIEALLLLTCWSLITISGWIAFSNNLTNLIEGRDLHHKTPRSTR
jgi:hypothetical protein